MVHPAAGQERPKPAMEVDVPQPGHFVRVTAPEYRGTGVYHGLYLPTDWKPGQTYPVIVEYAGNEWPPICTGRVEDCKLGYYASGGAGCIWLVLPFVNAQEKQNQPHWWGDVAATVAYCESNLERTCQAYGGDRARVLLTGFSRGAIACGYIGLHDDTIAALWAGLMPVAHCDGGSFTREGAPQRLARIGARPVLIICGQNDADGKANSLAGGKILQDQGRHPTFIEIPDTGHTDTWIEQPSPQRTALRHWMAQVPANIQALVPPSPEAAGHHAKHPQHAPVPAARGSG